MTIDRASFVPLHAQLKDALQRRIMGGGLVEGAALPPESALCATHGVSRITVRRALGDLEAEGLVRRVPGRGTFVAATSPRSGPTLGLIFGGLTERTFGHRNDAAFADMVRGAAEAAAARRAIVCPMPLGDEDWEAALTGPAARRMHGLLVHLTRTFTERMLRTLDGLGVPYVVIKRRLATGRASCVFSDDVAGARAATAHLLELGHRRVGLVLGPAEVGVWEDRRAGYAAAHDAAGVAPDPELVARTGYPMDEAGHRATLTLLRSPRPPTAIFAGNDYIALGVYRAIRELGGEPGRDVAVVGYGANPFTVTMYPALTSIGTAGWDLGNAAAELLLDVVEGRRRAPLQRELPWRLEVRQSSVGPVRAGAGEGVS